MKIIPEQIITNFDFFHRKYDNTRENIRNEYKVFLEKNRKEIAVVLFKEIRKSLEKEKIGYCATNDMVCTAVCKHYFPNICIGSSPPNALEMTTKMITKLSNQQLEFDWEEM